MSRASGGAAEWLSQSDFASELVSSLGRALGGGSPVSARKPKARAAAPSPLRTPTLDAAPPATPPPTPPPLSPPGALTPPPSPAPAPVPPALPALLSPLSLLSRRPSDPALAASASSSSSSTSSAPLPPPAPSQAAPAAPRGAGWDGLGDWDVTKLLPADKRESLHAAAAAFRAGLPGGGNPSALLGTALLGTTDGALRGFAGLMGGGGGGGRGARSASSKGGGAARR
jgi:hypothetical protein